MFMINIKYIKFKTKISNLFNYLGLKLRGIFGQY